MTEHLKVGMEVCAHLPECTGCTDDGAIEGHLVGWDERGIVLERDSFTPNRAFIPWGLAVLTWSELGV